MKVTLEEVFAAFDETHEEAKASIQNMLTMQVLATDPESKAFVELGRWILTSPLYDRYGYLPPKWCVTDAVSAERLLGHLYHAMVDDGDVCFVRATVTFTFTVRDQNFTSWWEEFHLLFEDRWAVEENPTKFLSRAHEPQNVVKSVSFYDRKDAMEWVRAFEANQEKEQREREEREQQKVQLLAALMAGAEAHPSDKD